MNQAARPRPPRFNPFQPEFRDDPYAVYRRLREQDPVHRGMSMWVVTRHADAMAVLRDRRFRSGLIARQIARQAALLGIEDCGAFLRLAEQSIVFTDNPDHARLRRLVGQVFTADRLAALEPVIAETAAACLAGPAAAGGMEAIGDFAEPVPLRVMCRALGIEAGMWQAIGRWTHDIRFLLEPGLLKRSDFARVGQTLADYTGFLAQLIDERRRRPGDDLISGLLAAGRGEDRLSQEELVHACIMVFVAGNATTRGLIGNGIAALLDNPGELAALRREPLLLPNAVLEMLRWDSPLQQTKRIASEAAEIGGTAVAEGDIVLVCLGAANRDPARFPEPDRLDLRRDTEGQLGFGFGMHACLGGRLAERQAVLVFEALLRAAPGLRDGGPRRRQEGDLITRGYGALPVAFGG